MTITRAGTPTGRQRRTRWAAAGLTALLTGAFLTTAAPAQSAPELLSQGMPATASSEENTDYTPASAAFDGDPGTRWSSEFGDPQWLQVDLGAVADLTRVELDWEAAYSTSYTIQASDDGAGWTTLAATDAGDGGADVLDVAGSGRYVRMHSTARNGDYGSSLWEMRVYGGPAGSDPGDPTDPPTDPTDPPTDPPGDPGFVDPGHPNVPVRDNGPSTVEVTGGNGGWDLAVDGSPYTVRGFTWGPSFDAADHYMPSLTAMNANTIRTWGTGADTATLLDSAAAHDVRVMMGFWLLPGGGPGSGGCIDYRTDDAYKSETRADILHWVDVYKDHPGVLMWNIGNEAILGLGDCFEGQDLEEVRHAYAAFVNEVSVAIHQADPNHPTTSTDAWAGAWPYIKAGAPDLDLLSINAYGDVCNIRENWEAGGYDRPYLLTEGGAAGEWEVDDDVNGVPDEPTDLEKGAAYVSSWQCLREHDGVSLGATFFHFGIEGDFGGVWFNVIPGDNKRLGYYSIARTWGADTSAMNTPPEITAMDVAGSTSVTAGGELTVDVDMSDPDGDPINPVVMLNSKYIDGSGGTALADFTETSPGTFSVQAPDRLGVWKIYVFAEDGQGNVGVETRSFRVVAPEVEGENIALGAEATASSFDPYNGNFTPAQAVDGDTSTRWASEWGPEAWLEVDLGSVQSFDQLQLVWEAAYGAAYEVRVSDDGAAWATVGTVADGNGGVDDLDVSGSGRYVRLNFTERGTDWGYSLFELGIYQR